MKTKLIYASIAAIIAFVLMGATDAPDPVIQVGKVYCISNGSDSVYGLVQKDLGNGWYLVNDKGAQMVEVNTRQAFTIVRGRVRH